LTDALLLQPLIKKKQSRSKKRAREASKLVEEFGCVTSLSTAQLCMDAHSEPALLKLLESEWLLHTTFFSEAQGACSVPETGFNAQAVPHQPAADAASSAAQLGAGL